MSVCIGRLNAKIKMGASTTSCYHCNHMKFTKVQIVWNFIGSTITVKSKLIVTIIALNLHWLWFLTKKKSRQNSIRNNFAISISSQNHRLPIIKYCLKKLIIEKNFKTEIYVFVDRKDYQNFKVELSKFQKYGVYIVAMKKDFRVYNKTQGPLQEKLEQPVLTLDDDTYYPSGFLDYFYNYRIKGSKIIVGTRGLIFNDNLSYTDMSSFDATTCKGKEIILTGKGGILYDFKTLELLQKNDAFLEKSPSNDDLWYHFFYKSLGFTFSCHPSGGFKLVDLPGERIKALRLRNVNGKENDKILIELKKLFH